MCLLKIGACLIQVCFNLFTCFKKLIHACLTQAACLIEVATKPDFTVPAVKPAVKRGFLTVLCS